MKPIEWLRATARQRKPATGGIVRIGDAPPFVEPTGYLMSTPETALAGSVPAGIIRIERDPTEAEVEELRRRFLDAQRTEAPLVVASMDGPSTPAEVVYDVPPPAPGYTEQSVLTSADLAVALPDPRPRADTETVPRCTCGVIYSRCYYGHWRRSPRRNGRGLRAALSESAGRTNTGR